MAKNANLYIRIDPKVKQDSEQLFASFGITISDAVNIFLHKSLMVGGLPFELKQSNPNAETLAAIQECEDILQGKIESKPMSVDEFFEKELG